MLCMMFFPTISALEMNENNMSTLFRDIDDVSWSALSQKLQLNQMLINEHCLRHTLKQWYNNTKGDPWTIWRRLAVIVEGVYGSKQGQQLRQHAGVGAYLHTQCGY